MTFRSHRFRSGLPAALALATGAVFFAPGICRAQEGTPAKKDPAAAAAPAADGKPVTLRLSFKEGEVSRYRGVARISSPALGGEAEQRQVLRQTVTRVRPDGAASVEAAIESQQVLVNGTDIGAGGDVSSLPKTTVTLDASGKILDYKTTGSLPGAGAAELQHAITLAGSMSLPDKPLKAGDTWTVEVENPMVKGKKIASTFTYVGREAAAVAGKDADRIKQASTIDTPDTGAIKAAMVYYLEPGTGKRLRTTGTLENFPIPQIGAVTIVVDQTLLPADSDKKPAAEPAAAGGKPAAKP